MSNFRTRSSYPVMAYISMLFLSALLFGLLISACSNSVVHGSIGVVTSEISGKTTEEGGQASFNVALGSKPKADVHVSIVSSDSGEGIVTPSELVFTPVNWNAPQTVTVTGVDDTIADGEQAYEIQLVTQSTDSRYDNLTVTPVAVSNVDNDTAGFLVSTVSGNTTEEGGQATFTLRLTSQPTADVTVNLISSDTSEGTIDKTSLTFTADNWNAPQTVTVTGQDDNLADGNQSYAIVFGATVSNDSAYAAIRPSAFTLTNIDNDSAGITVSPISGNTTEEGSQATFTIRLTSEPTADVIINLSSSNINEGTVDQNTVTFTSANWNAPQTVTVTGQDDHLVDGNQVYQVQFGATTSNDGNYAAIKPNDLTLLNIDNDSPGFIVSAITGNTTELGGQATFSVRLISEPTADVTVNLTSSDTSEGTVDKSSLTFTSVNWNAPQTVTVTGQDDNLADGNQSYAITFGATTSADTGYAVIKPANISVINIDNETAGFMVSAITGNTTESGGQATFTVRLTSQPTADVTVNLSSLDTSEGTIDKSALTFTAVNWNAPQTVTVTGQDDNLADGNQTYAITFGTTISDDAAYAAIKPSNVNVTNIDNDSAGFIVSAITGNTTESGGQATFTVRLTSQPTADVTVNLSSSDTSEGTIDKSALTFTAINWNAPQTVTVTGQDDNLADGNQTYAITFGTTISDDAAYAAIKPSNVNVTNIDNDSAGFIVSAITGNTTESGGQATFTVRLTSQPTADVTVNLSSSDTSEGTIDKSALTFTAVNWNAPQTVTVTGQDDNLADGNQTYAITFGTTVSGDEAYAAIKPSTVNVTNIDNESAGFVVSGITGNTTESGGTATFTVVLTSQPYADVIVNLSSADPTEGTIDKSSLTFSAGNWNTPQTVTVTGQDDNLADGNQSYAITFGATVSADAAYAAIKPSNVTVINIDNDSAGFIVSAISGDTTESGGTATFTVVLTSQPYADVTVNLSSADTTEGTINKSSLTFSSGNWNTPQTVTVTGVDDSIDDGDQPYTILFGATTSADPAYAAIKPSNVAVINTDNDSAGVTITPTTGRTTESGKQVTFSVVLRTEPTANVTLNFNTTDPTEGLPNVTSLTFTPGNWSTPQTFTVTGQNDTLSDGTQNYAIAFSATTTTDVNYAAIVPAAISLTNSESWIDITIAVEAVWLYSNPFTSKHDGGWVFSPSQNALYAIYGTDNEGMNVYRIDHNANTSAKVATLLYDRHGSHPVLDETDGYVYFPPSQNTNQLERISLSTNARETLASAPSSATFCQGAWKNGKLWIILDNGQLYAYDSTSNSWSASIKTYTNRGMIVANSSASSNDIYILIAGSPTTFEKYDTSAATFTSLANFPLGTNLGGNGQMEFVPTESDPAHGYIYAVDGCSGSPRVYSIWENAWYALDYPHDNGGCNGHAAWDSTAKRLYVTDGSSHVWYYQE